MIEGLSHVQSASGQIYALKIGSRKTAGGARSFTLSVVKTDGLMTKGANKGVAIQPSIAIVHVSHRPGHP